MKRSVYRLLLLITLLPMIAFPANAQDEAPPFCSDEEVAQIFEVTDQLIEAFSAVPRLDITQDNTELFVDSLLQNGAYYQVYFDNIYGRFPKCIDGVLVDDALAQQVSQKLVYALHGLLRHLNYEGNVTDFAMGTAFHDLFGGYIEASRRTGDSIFDRFSDLRRLETGAPEWLPACTEAQMSAGDLLVDLERRYDDQLLSLQRYLMTGGRVVNHDMYLALTTALGELYTFVGAGSSECAQLYPRATAISYKLADTFIALSLAQAIPLLEDPSDIEQLITLKRYFDDALNAHITPDDA
jgi:hypothetical protein